MNSVCFSTADSLPLKKNSIESNHLDPLEDAIAIGV